MVCAVAPGIPESLRRVPGGPHLLERLTAPFRIGDDGVRGPLLCAPLGTADAALGLLAVEGEPWLGEYAADDLETLVGIAAQASLSLLRLRGERITAEHAISPHDLAHASEVQRRLLPTLPDNVAGYEVAVEYSPAHHVGGDFFDLVPLGHGVVIALCGDVAGKGVSAALLMSRLAADFRRQCHIAATPGELLGALNDELCVLLPDDSFATAVCVRLDAPAGNMRVANAGHVLPVVRRRSGGVISVGRQSGAALGMLPGETYAEQTVPMEVGDVVLLMTDGVVEAVDNDPRNMWKLMDLVAQAPLDVRAISQQILAAVNEALGPRRVDDLTLLAIKPGDEAARAR
jgi:serine phosphatase RsbU (regulator of sigma subunit)